MHKLDLATVKAAKATDRRALAILAYDNATAEPEGANWRAVADMLRLALPAPKAAKIPEGAPLDPRFTPWADYVIPQNVSAKRLGKSPIVVVTFADGETVRAPAVSLPGKPINIGRAVRVAIAFYQARMAWRAGETSDWSACVAVPAIVSLNCETTGAEYDPADCSTHSAEWRRGSYDAAAVAAESLSRPEKSDDGTLTRADFVKCAYRLAAARLRLDRGADDAAARDVERYNLFLAGWTWLQIKAKWNADDEAARKAKEAAERAAAAPPAAPTFRVRPGFLQSSRLSMASTASPVVASARPACVLRVVA